MALGKFTLREIKSRPGRAILTLFSVVIGVATLVSLSIATATTRRAFNDLTITLNGRSTLEVTSEAGSSFDQSVEKMIQTTPGVEAAVPVIRQNAVMYYGDRKKVTLTILGIDEDKDHAVRDYQLIEQKKIEKKVDSVFLDNNYAQWLGLKVGDEVRFGTRSSGRRKFTIVGLIEPRGVSAVGQGVVYMPLVVAQKRLKEGEPVVDSIQIVTTADADVDKVQAKIKKSLPPGLVVLSASGRKSQADETLLGVERGLSLATWFSWLLALLVVLNTFQMNVVERRRQLSIMRAIGATRGQIMRVICREGIYMGLIGTALGLAVGLGGAYLLSMATAQLMQVALPPIQVSWLPVVAAAIVGPVISLFGAFLPAWRAGRLSPLEGMGAILPSEMEAPPKLIALIGLLLLGSGGGVLALCATRSVVADASVAGAMLLLIGAVLMIPIMLKPLTHFVSVLLSPVLRVEGRLAEGQIVRRRGRTTLTVGVLFLALAFGVGMANTISDSVADIQRWSRSAIQGDFFVRATMPDMNTGTAGQLPDEMDKEIRAIPGISSIQTVRFCKSEQLGVGVIIVAGDFTGEDRRVFQLVSGDPDTIPQKMAQGDVVIGTVFANRAKLKVGDSITLETFKGPKEVHVAGTLNDYMAGGLTMYMDKQLALPLLNIGGVDAYIIKASRGKLDDVAVELKKLATKYEVMFQTQRQLLLMIDNMIKGMIGCLWFVLVLVFVVAAFGVVNTLTMNVIEQTRELGLLRIVAMTRRQVRRMILAQATLLASIGLAPGVAAGLLVAYLLNLTLRPILGHPIAFSLHPVLLGSCFGAAFLIVLLAAWFPAARAARLKLAEALQYQ